MERMHSGQKITLFLVDGNPNGLVTAEVSNWNGHAISGPRTLLPEMLRREELSRTGIYFLTGRDHKSGRSNLYIGESDAVGKRLRSHANDAKKNFWEKTYLFTNVDTSLNKSNTRFLESRLVEIARQEARADVVNSTTHGDIKLSEADKSVMETTIHQVRLILPILGMDFLKPKFSELQPNQISAESFELIKPNGVNAKAREANGEFFVLKDSVSRFEWVGEASLGTSYARLHEELREQGKLEQTDDGLAVFTEDVPFSSPSAASAVVLGRQDNGRTSWKIEGTKKTYADWQNKKIRNAK